MAVVPRIKVKGMARPVPPTREREQARRINAVLASVDLKVAHDHVVGDERIELRWAVVTTTAPADGEAAQALPVLSGLWTCVWRRGLQTTRDFGEPHRPRPIVLGNAPSDPKALLQQVLDTPPLAEDYLKIPQAVLVHLRQTLDKVNADDAQRESSLERPKPRVPRVVRVPGEPLLPARFLAARRARQAP